MMLEGDLGTRIERLLGAKVESYRAVGGGYTPATRLLCETAKERFFVKAGATPLTSEFLRREIRVYDTVRGDFMPKVIAWEDHETAPILILEDLSAYHFPPPWDEGQIEQVLAQIDVMHSTKADIEAFAQIHSGWESNWQTVAADPEPFLSLGMVDARWLDEALPLLIEQEAQCRSDGDSLCHWDIRSDNICIAESRVVLVDWNLACLSNPKLDIGFWLPSLAYEAGIEPERILQDAPEVAAWVSGFFAARAGLPDIPDAPRVRLVQRQQLETALPWAVRALGLPRLKVD